jgi:hypothetical protein
VPILLIIFASQVLDFGCAARGNGDRRSGLRS